MTKLPCLVNVMLHCLHPQRFSMPLSGEHRPAPKHDRITIAALGGPDGDALLLKQIEQHRTIQLPAQGEPEQVAVAMRWIPTV